MKKLCLLLLLFIASCNSIKHAEKKITGNEAAFDRIGVAWAKQNPCANDTAFSTVRDTVQGSVDTFTQTIYERGNADTVFVDRTKTITKNVYIHDSTTGIIIDERGMEIEQKEAAKYKDLYSLQKDKTTDALNVAKQRLWWLIAFIAVFILVVALIFKFK
jgi:hypothetical protein